MYAEHSNDATVVWHDVKYLLIRKCSPHWVLMTLALIGLVVLSSVGEQWSKTQLAESFWWTL